MLVISPGADEALAHLRDAVDDLPEGGGVRITLETEEDGETGFALEISDAPQDGDERVDGHNLPVFLAADAAPTLAGMVLEGEVHGDHVHFGFGPQPEAAA